MIVKRGQKSSSHSGIAFYIESLLLVLFLLGCIIVLVRIFATSRNIGDQAADLTVAVNIARETAESFTASRDELGFEALVGVDGAVAEGEPNYSKWYTKWYDKNGNFVEQEDGIYCLEAKTSEEEQLRSIEITVQRKRSDTEVIYSLSAKTAKNR